MGCILKESSAFTEIHIRGGGSNDSEYDSLSSDGSDGSDKRFYDEFDLAEMKRYRNKKRGAMLSKQQRDDDDFGGAMNDSSDDNNSEDDSVLCRALIHVPLATAV